MFSIGFRVSEKHYNQIHFRRCEGCTIRTLNVAIVLAQWTTMSLVHSLERSLCVRFAKWIHFHNHKYGITACIGSRKSAWIVVCPEWHHKNSMYLAHLCTCQSNHIYDFDDFPSIIARGSFSFPSTLNWNDKKCQTNTQHIHIIHPECNKNSIMKTVYWYVQHAAELLFLGFIRI